EAEDIDQSRKRRSRLRREHAQALGRRAGWRRRRRCAAGAAAQIPDSGVGSARSGIGAAACPLISAASARTGRAGGAAGSRGRAARRTRIVPGGTSEQNVTLIEIVKKL